MEKFLQDLDVWVWSYRQNTRNYPGLHMTARQAACDALLRCLDLLEAAGPGARRTVPLRALAASDEAKITGGQKFVDCERLAIGLVTPCDDLRQIAISLDGKRAVVESTPNELHLLRQGIEDIRAGTGDYAIGPELRNEPAGKRDRESLVLWFWPCFGHLRPVP